MTDRQTDRQILKKLMQEGYIVAVASRIEVVHTELLCLRVRRRQDMRLWWKFTSSGKKDQQRSKVKYRRVSSPRK